MKSIFKFLGLCLVAGVPLAAGAQTPPENLVENLPENLVEDTRWKYRLLVTCDLGGIGDGFFANMPPARDDTHFSSWEPYFERDMVFVLLTSGQTGALIPVMKDGEIQIAYKLYKDDRLAMMQLANCPTDTKQYTLIGKDGLRKMSRDSAPHYQTVFDIIDAMPMRQQEMRE